MTRVCGDLGNGVISEGVESLAEYAWIAGQGVRQFQGYLFAKPAPSGRNGQEGCASVGSEAL